ncbi:MAG: glutaredoxin domain-containing protein [Deltaproteobacteria bacterium]
MSIPNGPLPFLTPRKGLHSIPVRVPVKDLKSRRGEPARQRHFLHGAFEKTGERSKELVMEEPTITVYGASWCPDCKRSKQFLGEHQIPYKWVDIEKDKAGEQFVVRTNKGKRIIPTIIFSDGSFLVEPSNAELAAKLGLKT